VTREDLTAWREDMLAATRSMLESLRPAAPAAPTPTPEPPINLAEIDEMLADGKRGAGEKVAALAERIADARVARVIKEQVEPLRAFGTNSLSTLARDRGYAVAAEGMGANGAKYVKQYAKEIDSFMATMSPEVRADVDAWKKATALVIGQHMPEILAAETEQAHRAGLDSRPDPSPAAAAPVDDDGSALPKAEDTFGPDYLKALSEKGQGSLDEAARRMGYKDGREYLKLARRIENYNEDLI
jgi:hypothetical protein